jgi:hypothetical protein
MEKSYPQAAMRDLLSTDPDKAARAADALYAMPGAAETFADPRAGEAVAESLARNSRTAAAVLLLGYSPAGSPVLKQLLREHGAEPVKLKPWSRTVPLACIFHTLCTPTPTNTNTGTGSVHFPKLRDFRHTVESPFFALSKERQ